MRDVLLPADVRRDGERADGRGRALAGLLTEVRQHHVRALLGEARAQPESDALRAAGHDAHLVLDVHGRSFRLGLRRATVVAAGRDSHQGRPGCTTGCAPGVPRVGPTN